MPFSETRELTIIHLELPDKEDLRVKPLSHHQNRQNATRSGNPVGMRHRLSLRVVKVDDIAFWSRQDADSLDGARKKRHSLEKTVLFVAGEKVQTRWKRPNSLEARGALDPLVWYYTADGTTPQHHTAHSTRIPGRSLLQVLVDTPDIRRMAPTGRYCHILFEYSSSPYRPHGLLSPPQALLVLLQHFCRLTPALQIFSSAWMKRLSGLLPEKRAVPMTRDKDSGCVATTMTLSPGGFTTRPDEGMHVPVA